MLRCFTVQVVAWAPVVWATSPGTAKASKSGWDFLCSFLDFAWYFYILKGSYRVNQWRGAQRAPLSKSASYFVWDQVQRQARRIETNAVWSRDNQNFRVFIKLPTAVTKVGLVIISIATAKHDVLASFATYYRACLLATTKARELWWNIKPFCTPSPKLWFSKSSTLSRPEAATSLMDG